MSLAGMNSHTGKDHRQVRRFAFVLPRFGKDFAGGAETLCSELAHRLSLRGDRVEIFTTCARDNRTWLNEIEPGVSEIDGLVVRRFKVDARDLESWIPKQIAINDGMRLSLDDQLEWMQHSVNSSDMYSHIAQYAAGFDLIFFAPYLFGTTFWGSLISPERSVLIPCLHDECYAYADIIQSMFRQVRGCLFNTLPEQELCNRLYGAVPGGVVGMGFEPERDIRHYPPYFDDQQPYIVYLGRKETGKNVHSLLDYFVQAKEHSLIPAEIKLVIAGGGDFSDLHRDSYRSRTDLVDLPHITEEQKRALLQHSLCLIQPSLNESFSIVLMESWMQQTPVLVNADCPVTRHQVISSNGGLYYSGVEDFAGVISYLHLNPDLKNRLGAAGLDYVRTEYDWQAVMKRFELSLENLGLEAGHFTGENPVLQ